MKRNTMRYRLGQTIKMIPMEDGVRYSEHEFLSRAAITKILWLLKSAQKQLSNILWSLACLTHTPNSMRLPSPSSKGERKEKHSHYPRCQVTTGLQVGKKKLIG